MLDEFQRTFNLESVREFWQGITLGDAPELELTAGTVISLTSTSRVTPVSILYYGVGKAVAGKLPGHLGNVLLSPGEVPEFLGQLENVISGENRDAIVRRGAQLYRLDHYPCESEVAQILDAWPTALRTAVERDCGLLSVGLRAP
ncbi:MAG TPA: hypothetical protein PKE27_00975 [Povalibacter sp.]|uniref:hypothetical protein n=1 Tax=Povalibacter sp. TaxID=1962978 RepID=UPI002C8D62D3|nr:hypothetical protein [Povalibacter sp.]HMN43120.1 hypothetical protein [Povalibacter sp.]